MYELTHNLVTGIGQRSKRWRKPDVLLLLILVLAMIAMPVSYKAGTQTEHTHTIFQGIVDTLVGHPHHHADQTATEIQPRSKSALSPFLSANVPLSVAADELTISETTSSQPDIPTVLGLNAPMDAGTPIAVLGALVALLLADRVAGATWGQAKRLQALIRVADTPPPRLAI